LASLVLFVVLARSVSPSELGVFVAALAYVQIALVPVQLGFDRWLLRAVAADREAGLARTADVLFLKLAIAAPVMGGAVALAALLGYDGHATLVVAILAGALLVEALRRTPAAVFLAIERNELDAAVVVVQRVVTATVGIAVLAAGFGVVAVALSYGLGALTGSTLAVSSLRRVAPSALGRPKPGRWGEVIRAGAPFAGQDVFGTLLARQDAVLLSMLATNAAVGLYGAAYRLFEATLFISQSINAAFAAMFTYLGRDSSPTLAAVFGRALKLTIAALLPGAVAFGLLAEPLTHALFGADLEAAAPALRILAPVVLLYGVVLLGSSLLVSRRGARIMVPVTAVMALLNLTLNLILIPAYGAAGAAAAMFATELAFVAVLAVLCVRETGRLAWGRLLPGPVLAGAAMVAAMVLLNSVPALALAAGAAVYAVSLAAAERLIAPADLAFAVSLLRRRTAA
jgi:O-antigen/teichoic acid export membrane protein